MALSREKELEILIPSMKKRVTEYAEKLSQPRGGDRMAVDEYYLTAIPDTVKELAGYLDEYSVILEKRKAERKKQKQ